MQAVYKPEWTGPVEGMVVNFIHKHVWKTEPEFGFDDLYQEAYVLFCKCLEKCRVGTPQQFMAYFKRALFNLITGLAVKRTTRREYELDFNEEDPVNVVGQKQLDITRLECDLILEALPEKVIRILKALQVTDDFDATPVPMLKSNGCRETTNEYLSRLAGVAPCDLKYEIESILL